jgi:hypothetical protein
MVSRTARFLAATVTGTVLAFGAAACASDSIDDYLADVKAAAPGAGLEVPTDGQALVTGAKLCGLMDYNKSNGLAMEGFKSEPLYDVIAPHCDLFPLTAEQNAQYRVAESAGASGGTASGLSERGAIPAEVGKPIERTGPPEATEIGQIVTVTAMKEVGTDCPELAQYKPGTTLDPENGRILALDLTVKNTPTYDAKQPGYYLGSFVSREFVSANGTAVPGVDADMKVAFCTKDDEYFSPGGAGRTYTGAVYVDLPRDAGWLIVGPAFGGDRYEFWIPAA